MEYLGTISGIIMNKEGVLTTVYFPILIFQYLPNQNRHYF